MFYEHLDCLCAERGLTVTELMKKLKLNPSSASRWKNKGYLPSRSTAKKMADYFGITVSELMADETEEAPAKEVEADEMTEMLEDVRRNPDLKLLFSLTKNAKPEDVRKTIDIFKTIRGDDDGRNNY